MYRPKLAFVFELDSTSDSGARVEAETQFDMGIDVLVVVAGEKILEEQTILARGVYLHDAALFEADIEGFEHFTPGNDCTVYADHALGCELHRRDGSLDARRWRDRARLVADSVLRHCVAALDVDLEVGTTVIGRDMNVFALL